MEDRNVQDFFEKVADSTGFYGIQLRKYFLDIDKHMTNNKGYSSKNYISKKFRKFFLLFFLIKIYLILIYSIFIFIFI